MSKRLPHRRLVAELILLLAMVAVSTRVATAQPISRWSIPIPASDSPWIT
jgi:hypothetical protein